MQYKVNDLSDLPSVATAFIEHVRAGGYNIIEFYGSMGAGKTTFIREICSQLGVEDVVTSPTFAIINEYRMREGGRCYHFDFYRINKLEEVMDMGYEEYFYSGNLCLIEWPEMIEELLPEGDGDIKPLKLTITHSDGGGRIIEF